MNKNKLRIKAIRHMKKLIKEKRYIVADSCDGLIIYDREDYNNVIENLEYVTPIPITKFKSFEKALAYIKDESEGSTFE